LVHGGAGGAPTGWTTVFVGDTGDARDTSQGRILYNEFLGDYVYAMATRDYGAGMWTDVQNTANCPAMDAWRRASFNAGHQVFPAPWPLADCPANFGNKDIFSATTAPWTSAVTGHGKHPGPVTEAEAVPGQAGIASERARFGPRVAHRGAG
jgi:hypothetical protein